VKVRNAYYWPTDPERAEFARDFQIMECRSDGPRHWLMVPRDWACMSPLPDLGAGEPVLGSVFYEDPGAPERSALMAVLFLPDDQAFFAHELAEAVARHYELTLSEVDPAAHKELMATASSDQQFGFLSVAHHADAWLCFVGLAPAERKGQPVERQLGVGWATFLARKSAVDV